MSDCPTFHTQVASIMEVLANTAVAEICKLVDDGYAVLRFEMSRSQKENATLKRKLKMLELKVSRGCVETTGEPGCPDGAVQVCDNFRGTKREEVHFPAAKGLFTKQTDVSRGRNVAENEEGSLVVLREEEDWTEMLNIKKERFEDPRNRDPRGDVKITKGTVEQRADSGESTFIHNTQDKPAEHTEELTEEHRTRHSVWELSGLESVLKAEPENESGSQRIQHGGSEHIAGRLNCQDSECVTYETTSHLGTYLTEGAVETQDPDHSCTTNTNSEKLSLRLTDEPAMNGCASFDTNFTMLQSIKSQCRAGTRKKWFVCKYCGKNFSRRNVLETHHRVHTGEKPFSCTLCGKKFSDSSNLKKHQSVHTGEKPFRCAQCGMRFSDSSSRKRHQSVHTGKKPFSCTQCGKRFTRSCHLKRHCQQFHTWQDPFNDHSV